MSSWHFLVFFYLTLLSLLDLFLALLPTWHAEISLNLTLLSTWPFHISCSWMLLSTWKMLMSSLIGCHYPLCKWLPMNVASEKIVFLEKCSLYIFCFRTFTVEWCLFDLFWKIYQKFENAGHMRPGPWKSCHPREKKIGPAMSQPPPLFWPGARCRGGRERALDMVTNSPKLKCLFLVIKKSKYIHITNCQLGRQHKQYWNLSCQ